MQLTGLRIAQELQGLPYFSGEMNQNPAIWNATDTILDQNRREFATGKTDFPRFRRLHGLLAADVRNNTMGRLLRDKPVRVVENGPGQRHFSIAKIVAEAGHHYMAKEIEGPYGLQRLVNDFIPELSRRIFYPALDAVTPAEIVYWAYPDYDSGRHDWNLSEEEKTQERERFQHYARSVRIDNVSLGSLRTRGDQATQQDADMWSRELDHRTEEMLRAAYLGKDVMLGGYLVIETELDFWISSGSRIRMGGGPHTLFHPAIWEHVFLDFDTTTLPGRWGTALEDEKRNSLLVLKRIRI